LRAALVAAILLAGPASAQEADARPDWLPPTYVAASLGVNVGLFAIDVSARGFYGFAAGNVGVPLLDNGSFGAFAFGAGLTRIFAAGDTVVWTGELFALAQPGWANYALGISGQEAFFSAGVGMGMRFIFKSRLVLGLKFPLMGAAFSPSLSQSYQSASNSVGVFYLASAVALPLVSLGFRF
jgi:hypothetical protein